VERVQRDLAAYDSWQLLSEFRYESGTPQQEAGGESPGKELDFTARLYSPPIAERWRLLGGYEYHLAKVTEGIASRFRQRAGLEWRLPDFTLEGIFWYSEGSLQRPGGSIAARWAPTDHWTFRFGKAYGYLTTFLYFVRLPAPGSFGSRVAQRRCENLFNFGFFLPPVFVMPCRSCEIPRLHLGRDERFRYSFTAGKTENLVNLLRWWGN
jgi:hypothetical protein